jgi:phosphoglycerate dehydrogenase-like enzyme
MKIVIPDDFTNTFASSPHLERLKRLGEVVIFSSPVPDEQEAIRRLQGAQIVAANRERTPFTRKVLESLPDLKLLSVTGPFFNNVDFPAATELGIVVTKTPSSAPRAVAELVFGLMIAVFRRIPRGDAAIRRGEWPALIGEQLSGKTLGIIGVGNNGSLLTDIATAFQMSTVAWGPFPSDREQALKVGAKYLELDELLRTSDVVTLHVRYSEITKGLIGAREISLMKPSAVLINTSRAGVTDEKALIAALQEGRLAGAGLDVFMKEPLPPDSPLIALDNVVMTPHIGFTTTRVAALQAEWAIDNVDSYMAGKKPEIANPEVWEKRRQ